MAKVILIGGAPRVGKTTLTLQALQQKPMLAASTDALRYMLRQVLDDKEHPGLFTIHKYTSDEEKMSAFLNDSLSEALSDQKKENIEVWKSTQDFIHSNLEDGRDVLIEGVHIIPELIQKAGFDYKVVFLGNQSEEHAQMIFEKAKSNPSDWLSRHSDKVILGWARFTREFSKYIQEEAEKYSMPYIETDDNNFQASLEQALQHLLD